MPKIAVDEAPAGPAMDAAVAEALGWVKVECDGVYYWADPQEDEWHTGRVADQRSVHGYLLEDMRAWSPSTDIAAAWELVKKLYMQWDNFFAIFHDTGHWYCENVEGFMENHICTIADTAPFTICRAFLKANGVEYVEVPE